MSKSDGKFSVFNSHFHLRVRINSLSPLLVFTDTTKMFDIFDTTFRIYRDGHNPITHFLFVQNMTFDQLSLLLMLEVFQRYQKIPTFGGSIFEYLIFITNEADTVQLSTFEWFSPHGCDQLQLSKLNSFNKKSQKWNSKLEYYEKFLNYHNCELIMMLPTLRDDESLEHMSGYMTSDKDLRNIEFKGISPEILRIISKNHNFTIDYQPVIMSIFWMRDIFNSSIEAVKLEGKELKKPHIYFEIVPATIRHVYLTFSNVVSNLNILMFVTPAETYTAYEKFILPFDMLTWILVLTTFVATFLSIFIINHFSKSAQSLVYGHKVDTPFWNVISIFFGISQTRLPNRNFSRFILLIFIYFCLIFRTCFQSKFFEFMTSEPRKPPPKTLEDLLTRSYTVYTVSSTFAVKYKYSELEKWPPVKVVKSRSFLNLYSTQSQNSSAKLALIVDEIFTNYFDSISKQRNHEWNKLDSVLFTTHDNFIFFGSCFYAGMLHRAINNLIPTGVMDYLIENFYTKRWKFENEEAEPKVLSLDDLSFGFNIWLGSCLVSFVAFAAEHGIAYILRPKKLKFAKVLPIRYKNMFQESRNLSPDLINIFRVQKAAYDCSQSLTANVDDENLVLDSIVLLRAQSESNWFF
ncbi:unnamed protein product [Chironomus riparius]|uniref:Ionotropic glutamate receptor C-terminal domain-containing protein n=1 Tax=Chironomus riparius TaxID=315576 RepID=A0A9N9S554_9DIPT|nr:unnamed protein product [Chironomus riparius]